MSLIVSALGISPYHSQNISLAVEPFAKSTVFLSFLVKIWAGQDMGQEEALELEVSLKWI